MIPASAMRHLTPAMVVERAHEQRAAEETREIAALFRFIHDPATEIVTLTRVNEYRVHVSRPVHSEDELKAAEAAAERDRRIRRACEHPNCRRKATHVTWHSERNGILGNGLWQCVEHDREHRSRKLQSTKWYRDWTMGLRPTF